MPRVRYAAASACLLAAALLFIACASSAPALDDVKVAPAAAGPGARVVVTAKVEDPAHRVARVEASIVGHRLVETSLNDAGRGHDERAGDGTWSVAFHVPDAPSGPYQVRVALLDASGKVLQAQGKPLALNAALEIKDSPTAQTETLDVPPAAARWRTEAQIAKIRPREPGESFRFVVMGDNRDDGGRFARLLRVAAGLKPDFSFDLGDLVNSGRFDQFAALFKQIQDVNSPFLVAAGNHDLGASQGRLFAAMFGPTDYYFDHGSFRFVVVDNSRHELSPKQLMWLEDVLTTDQRKVVLMHAPPSVIEAWNWHCFHVGAREFADLMAAKQVERVYVGHIHGFDVEEYKGVRYVLSGGAGVGPSSRIAPGDFNHIVSVHAGPKSLVETVYRLDGTQFVVDPQKWMTHVGQ